jgi:hypothetical protein
MVAKDYSYRSAAMGSIRMEQCFAQNQSCNLNAARTERHADPDLVRLTAHRVGQPLAPIFVTDTATAFP